MFHVEQKEMIELDNDLPEINDVVKLRWNGYHRVPKWLSGQLATVLEITKQGNLKIQAHGESSNPRTIIYPNDVYPEWKDDNK